MSVDVAPEQGQDEEHARPADLVAGYLAALAIFAALVGLAWHPLRLILPAIVLAMISAGMSSGRRQLTLWAVGVTTACFFFGMVISVVTERPLW